MRSDKTRQVTFRLTEDMANKFKALCSSRGTSLQFILERFVKEFIGKKRKEVPA